MKSQILFQRIVRVSIVAWLLCPALLLWALGGGDNTGGNSSSGGGGTPAQCQQIVQQLQSAIDQIKNSISQSLPDLQSLQTQIQAAQATKDQLNQQLKNAPTQIPQLQTDLQACQTKLQSGDCTGVDTSTCSSSGGSNSTVQAICSTLSGVCVSNPNDATLAQCKQAGFDPCAQQTPGGPRGDSSSQATDTSACTDTVKALCCVISSTTKTNPAPSQCSVCGTIVSNWTTGGGPDCQGSSPTTTTAGGSGIPNPPNLGK